MVPSHLEDEQPLFWDMEGSVLEPAPYFYESHTASAELPLLRVFVVHSLRDFSHLLHKAAVKADQEYAKYIPLV